MRSKAHEDGMTFGEAAKVLDVTWKTIKTWGETGKLATYRRDGESGPWMVSRLSVARLVKAAAEQRSKALKRQSRVLKKEGAAA